MLAAQVDITNCDREPIHIPGRVQSHGFLIVLDNSYIIRYYSNNIRSFLTGIPDDVLGQPFHYIEPLFGNTDQPDFITQLLNFGSIQKNFEQINPFQIDISGITYNLLISISGHTVYVLEFEPALPDFGIQKMIGRSVSEMLADKHLQNMLSHSAVQVKKIIGYDRVMIYRFAEDGHGEVIAEAKNEDLEPWLGLHYPASDIPKQARELYKLNLTRLIADVNTIPSDIVTTADQQQLDLTHSQLRAVSPIHIQYLKNMGVASSFSISLLYKGELWGLIACHNYTPRFIDYKAREASKLIGQILSSALEYRQDEENQEENEVFKNNIDKLSKYLQKNESIEDALTRQEVTLLDVVRANGAVLVYEKNIARVGTTPDDKQLKQLLSWIKNNVHAAVYHSSNFSAVESEASSYRQIGSGILVAVLSREMEEYIIWFKPELVQKIRWAGNPEKPVEVNETGSMQLSPRHSFEVWSQTVSGTSERWSAEEINSVIHLKEEITYAINLKAGAIRLLNEKLRYAYEELDTFSFTISHDLKNPIAAIKGLAQVLSKDTAISGRSQKLLLMISEQVDKMNFMINEVLDYSRIGRSEVSFKIVDTASLIGDIVKELEQVYDSSNLQLTIGSTPDLVGDPVMLSQLFSNLIGNAIKYSQHAKPPMVHIEGSRNENEINYIIKDNGIGIAGGDLTKIFELFNRMDNVKDIEGSGLGLAIAKRIVEKHSGKIWVESELGNGSTFFVSFTNKVIQHVDQTND